MWHGSGIQSQDELDALLIGLSFIDDPSLHMAAALAGITLWMHADIHMTC